jgi:hypothetical protein
MFAYLGKSITWVIRSAVALVGGLGALVLNQTSSAGAAINNWHPPGFPPWPPHHNPPVVPEVNTGLVLVPIVLAIFLFTSRRLWRQRSVQNR